MSIVSYLFTLTMDNRLPSFLFHLVGNFGLDEVDAIY